MSSAPIQISYRTQVRAGREYVQLQREVTANVVPTKDMLVDFTPLGEKSNPKLLFHVAGPIELRHADPSREERVVIGLGRACVPENEQPGAEYLQQHGFRLVREP